MTGVPPTEPGLDLSPDEVDSDVPQERSATIGTGTAFAAGCVVLAVAVVLFGIVLALMIR